MHHFPLNFSPMWIILKLRWGVGVQRERLAVRVDRSRSDAVSQFCSSIQLFRFLPILETLLHVVRILCYDIARPTGLG
jgi:hypothetical protein